MKLQFKPESRKGIMPEAVDIQCGLHIKEVCSTHNGVKDAYMFFFQPFNELVDTLRLEGNKAIITGIAKMGWKNSAMKTEPGIEIPFQECDCIAVRMTDIEIAQVIGGKLFEAVYADGHLVDER